MIAFLREGSLFLQSRRGADLTGSFPDLARAAAAVGEDLVLDGELVTYTGGRLDFTCLQECACRTGRAAADLARARPAHVIVFDLLEASGTLLLDCPYRERRAALEQRVATGTLGGAWALGAATADRG